MRSFSGRRAVIFRLVPLLFTALVLFAAPCLAAEAVPAFDVQSVRKVPGMKLSLDCVLAEPVDEATLRALGQKAYDLHKGKSYKSVFIMWYLPKYTIGAGAWGITNCVNGGWDVRVVALQG